MEKPAAPAPAPAPVTEATANGIDVNGEAGDDEGDEWQASARSPRFLPILNEITNLFSIYS